MVGWKKLGNPLKSTRYFEEQVLRKRPYIQRRWCDDVLAAPIAAKRNRTAAFGSGAELSCRGRVDRDTCGL